MCGVFPNCICNVNTGHSSSLVPSTTTSDSPAQEGYDTRGRMLDWKDPVGSSENTDPYAAVSSHNHQDKKGKALEMNPRGGGRGGGVTTV